MARRPLVLLSQTLILAALLMLIHVAAPQVAFAQGPQNALRLTPEFLNDEDTEDDTEALGVAQAMTPKKIIIDTDPGVDD
ncbi:MAG: nucleoside hydrolase, partial [Caldilineaceae bacterium]|nr:nucleoside hydrolase [Caldilineaceae bacterium]